MRILLVGAGGVGSAFARIAARRQFAEVIVADYDLGRAQRAAAASDRFTALQIDARDEQAVADLLTAYSADALMNATDPRFVMPLYRAALRTSTNYLDMAMSLSHPDQKAPYSRTGVKLGDEQFELTDAWTWDMYRPARFVSRVQVVTTHDVNIEELTHKELAAGDALGADPV